MPSFNTLVDDFQDGALAAAWSGSYGTVTETGGTAQIASDTGWAALATPATYSLNGAAVYAEVTPAPGTGATTEAYSSMMVASGTAGTRLVIDRNALTNTVRFGNDVGYWDNAGMSLAYDAAAMRWWRIREAAGTCYLETSPDAGTWTTRHSFPTPAWVSGETLSLMFEAHQDAGASTYTVDNVNRSGPVAPPTMGLGPAVVKMRAANGSWLNVTLRLLPLGYGPITIPEVGIKPTNYTQTQLDAHTTTLYDNWKAHLREKPENGWWAVLANAQIDPDTGIAENPYVAEGQGYGLMILAQMAPHDILAKSYFDGIVKYVLDHPSAIDPDLHAAQQDADMVSRGGGDSATDGDMDIAMGLLMGHGRWGSGGTHNYLEIAKTKITAIKRSLISPTTGLLELGDWSFGNWENVSRPSDWMIGHFEQFAWATGDTDWHTIREAHLAAVARLQEFYSGRTGLLPDFTVNAPATVAPAPPNTLESDNDGRYYYNACRVPWRLGAAQSTAAREAAARISKWSEEYAGGVPTNFTAGYYLNGAPLNTYTDMSFIAPLTVAASVAGDQAWLDALWGHLAAHTDEPLYYPASLQLLTMIEVAGTYRITPSTAVPPIVGNWQMVVADVPASVRSYATSTHAYAAGVEVATRPPIALEGDLVVLYTLADSGTFDDTTFVLPPGFTELGRVIGNPGVRKIVSYRIATANEPATYEYGAYPAADGASMAIAIQDWDGDTANLAFGISDGVPSTLAEEMNTPSVTPKTGRNLMLTSIATDDDVEPWVWGWHPPKEAGAVGYVHNAGYWCSGSVSHEVHDSTAPTGSRTWDVNTSSTQTTRMTSTLLIGSGSKITQAPQYTDTHTGGTGGELVDATDIEFVDSTGVRSVYHLFAAGLDWTQNVGLMIYGDGSGEWGLQTAQLNSPYLLGGQDGLVAVAKRQNMVLLTPRAPGGGCVDGDGVCWYGHSEPVPATGSTPAIPWTSPWQKLEWSHELITTVLASYNIDRRRIAIGGYSSGAQWTTAWWGPKYASQVMLDGVAVGISYGGPPRVAPNITEDYKANVEHLWDTGDADTSYSEPTWDDGVQIGRSWYQNAGFAVTDLVLHPGVTHDRYTTVGGVLYGDFGKIMEEAITTRVMNTDGTIPEPPPEPTTPPLQLRSLTTATVPSSTTSNKAVATPAGTSEGDLLFMALTAYGTNSSTVALPTGYTQLAKHTRTTSHTVVVGYRVATANEPATYTPNITTGNAYRCDILCYQNADATRLSAVPMGTTPASSVSHNAPSITPTTDSGLLLCWVSGGGGNTWTQPAGMTERTDSQTAASYYLSLSVAEEPRTSTAATGTRTFGGGGGNYAQVTGSLFIPWVGSA